MLLSAALLAAVAVGAATTPSARSRLFLGNGSAPEPYPYLNGGAFTGGDVPGATDPLAQYQWTDPEIDPRVLQLYNLRPSAAVQTDGSSSSFENVDSLLTKSPNMTINGLGTVRLDFGLENPAWLELDIVGPPGVETCLMLGIGEMDEVYQWGHRVKSMPPVRYGDTIRLETNPQLYEGVRFAFINVNSTPSAAFRVVGLRLVCQAMPVNYSATFAGATQLESQVWAAAVYTVRTNLEPDGFGAVLIDRGDRIAWVGDDHVAQATAMAALGGANGLVLSTLLNTSQNTNNGIETYSLYWVLSLCDYFAWSGNASLVLDLSATVAAKLDHAASIWSNPTDLRFVGWDDRLGAGFSNASTVESQILYRFLTIHAMADAGAALTAAGNSTLGLKFSQQAESLFAQALVMHGQGLSTHSAAALINTGLANDTLAAAIADTHLNDVTQICSLSNFNQYFLLNALGRAGRVTRALESISRCWGSEVQFGGTTFFEISDPSWPSILPLLSPLPGGENGPTSSCHPWSSGAAPWMTGNLLGVRRPEARLANHAAMVVSPHLAGIGPGASRSGSVAIPPARGSGVILVHVGVSQHPDEATVVVNRGAGGGSDCIEVRLGVSATADNGMAVDPSRAEVAVAASAPVAARFDLKCDGSSNHLGLLVAQSVCLHAGQSATLRAPLVPIESRPIESQALLRAQAAPFPPASYPAQYLGVDHATQGDWLGKYGSKGYILLSFVDTNTDLTKLPPGVVSVSPVYRSDRACWSNSTTDRRALQHPDGPDKPRGVGAVASLFGGNPTVAIEVAGDEALMPKDGYTVSLYVVDWDQRGRRQTVAPLTGYPELQPAAQHVDVPGGDDFVAGMWFSWKMPAGGARFRFNWIRGDNAVVSAIMFD